MTDQTLPPNSPTDRITALESGLTHLREIVAIQDRIADNRITQLIEHNRVQDTVEEKRAAKLAEEIGKIRETLWSALKWLGTALATTLLSVGLKALGLI